MTTTSSYLAAALQMNSQPDPESNIQQARSLVKKAAERGCRLVCLPENFPWMGNPRERAERSERIAKSARDFLAEVSSDYGVWLSGGTYPEPLRDSGKKGKVYARSLLMSPEGKTVASYDKMHLFDVDLPGGESYRESDYIEPGAPDPVVSDTGEIGKLGLTVCYDLRFPELYRALSGRNAQVLLVPSAFTRTTGGDHWHALLRARAIENTCYVIAAAQTGKHGGSRETYGHAMILDPWGKVLADAGTGVGLAVAEIDYKRLREVRRSLPSLEHRRIQNLSR